METCHRSSPLPEHICSISSSELKYIWKMQTPLQSNTNVLYTADVTKVITKSKDAIENCDKIEDSCIRTEQMVPSSLLLTPELIHLISVDEDVQECTYPLEDVEIIYEDNDPTKFLLYVEPNKLEAKGYSSLGGARGAGDELHPSYVSDRVVQFVMESGAHCAISDIECEYSDGLGGDSADPSSSILNKRKKTSKTRNLSNSKKTNSGRKDKSKAILFHASPTVITAFRNIFTVALAQKMGKGFEVL